MHAKPSGISHVEQSQTRHPIPSPLMRREAEGEEGRWAGTGTQQRESRATRLRFVFCYLRYTLAKRVVIWPGSSTLMSLPFPDLRSNSFANNAVHQRQETQFKSLCSLETFFEPIERRPLRAARSPTGRGSAALQAKPQHGHPGRDPQTRHKEHQADPAHPRIPVNPPQGHNQGGVERVPRRRSEVVEEGGDDVAVQSVHVGGLFRAGEDSQVRPVLLQGVHDAGERVRICETSSRGGTYEA